MIYFSISKSTECDVYRHLIECVDGFVPSLDSYVDIEEYSKKIYSKANRYEAWSGEILVGLIAAYFIEERNTIFISNVSVVRSKEGSGLGRSLYGFFEADCRQRNISVIDLEVKDQNERAINFYLKNQFKVTSKELDKLLMSKIL